MEIAKLIVFLYFFLSIEKRKRNFKIEERLLGTNPKEQKNKLLKKVRVLKRSTAVFASRVFLQSEKYLIEHVSLGDLHETKSRHVKMSFFSRESGWEALNFEKKGNLFIWALVVCCWVLWVFFYFSLHWTVTGIWESNILISCSSLMVLTTHLMETKDHAHLMCLSKKHVSSNFRKWLLENFCPCREFSHTENRICF